MPRVQNVDSTKMEEQNFNTKEERLKKFAQVAWNKAMRELFFPPLNEPHYIFDYSNNSRNSHT